MTKLFQNHAKKFSLLLLVSAFFTFGCQEKDPSIAKIFLRNENSILIENMELILKSDLETTPAFTQVATTNQAGYALFQLEEVFNQFGKKDKERMADFNIFMPDGDTVKWIGEISARPHITAVKTIYLLD